MKICIEQDQQAASLKAAKELIALLQQKPDACICIASGDTPRLTCELFTHMAKEQQLHTGDFYFVGLDEWVGLDVHTYGSCHYDFQTRLFDPLELPATQYHLFDGKATNLSLECKKMDDAIAARGGIDLMIVGIGMNGHIGFNEPGTSWRLRSHVIDLDPVTLEVGKRYFKEAVELGKGITLGLAHLMQAKQVILMATGERKAAVVQKAAEGLVSESLPASIIQEHPNAMVLTDAAAGALLSNG